MKEYKIDVRALVAANEFASDEDTRYYLKGVYLTVQDGKLTCVATNGHRLIMIPYGEDPGHAPNVIIPSDLIKKIKINKKHYDQAIIKILDQAITIEYDNMSFAGLLVDGTYPDYIRVIPDGDMTSIPSIVFNPEYLGSFAKVNKILNNGKSVGSIKMNFYGSEKPCVITTPEYKAVLMPMRT